MNTDPIWIRIHNTGSSFPIGTYLVKVLNPGEEGGQVEKGGQQPEQGQSELKIQPRQQGRVILLPKHLTGGYPPS